MAIRCLSVDDHPAVLEGLGFVLAGIDDIELVATVVTGEAALEALEQIEVDTVLVDVRLPGIDGISVVRRIRSVAPQLNFVMFSAYGDRRLLSDALAAGARGYVLKSSPPADLLRAIRTVSEGRPFVDPSLSPALLIGEGVSGGLPLSEREREILQLLAGGLHTQEVAHRIALSVETVKSDTKRALGKLEAETRTHAVALALRQALIE